MIALYGILYLGIGFGLVTSLSMTLERMGKSDPSPGAVALLILSWPIFLLGIGVAMLIDLAMGNTKR